MRGFAAAKVAAAEQRPLGAPLCRPTAAQLLAEVRLPSSFPDEWDLEVGRTVLLGVEAAAVDVARAPKQHLVRQVDQVVFHEVLARGETERRKGLSEHALRLTDFPFGVTLGRNLIQDIRETLQERRDLVGLVSNEVDFLGARGNRMVAA